MTTTRKLFLGISCLAISCISIVVLRVTSPFSTHTTSTTAEQARTKFPPRTNCIGSGLFARAQQRPSFLTVFLSPPSLETMTTTQRIREIQVTVGNVHEVPTHAVVCAERSSFFLAPDAASKIKDELSGLPPPYFEGDFRDPSYQNAYKAFMDTIDRLELKAASIIARHLSADLLTAIQQLKDNHTACPFAVIDNCPIGVPAESITPSPYGTDIPIKPDYAAEWFMIGLSNLLGKPMGYMNEKNAQLIHQIAPDGQKESSLSSAGSKFELPPHTEAAALSARPDYLILGCVRGDRENRAVTSIHPVDDAVHYISNSRIIDSLEQASFKHGLPPSFGDYDTSQLPKQRPSPILVETSPGHYEVNLDMETTKPWSPNDYKSSEAIKMFGNALQQVKVQLLLQEGQVVILNNRRVLHGRNSFKCHDDGRDRWLHRVYVARDLEDTVASSDSTCVHGRIFDNGHVKIV